MKYVANPSRSRRPYIYFKKLQFLLNDSEMPATMPQQIDADSSGSEDGKKNKWKLRKSFPVIVKHDESEDDNADDNRDDDSGNTDYEEDVRPTPAKIPKNKPSIDQFAFANVDVSPKNDDCDPDRLFLLSLLPHLKSVPEVIRLNVKMDLMKVLQTANFKK